MESIQLVIIGVIEKTVSQGSFCGRNHYREKGKLNSSTSCFLDVNECATEKHNCDNSSVCHNTQGFFLCICREPEYFGANCTGKCTVQDWIYRIVDSSDKKRSLCDRELSNGEIIDIAVVTDDTLRR